MNGDEGEHNWSGTFADALRVFVQGRGNDPQFAVAYFYLVKVLASWAAGLLRELHQDEDLPAWCAPEDFASDYLLELRRTCARSAAAGGYLRRDFRSFVAGKLSPASHKLWELLSDALQSLRGSRSVWFVGASEEETVRNHADALWTADPSWNAAAREDLLEEWAENFFPIFPRITEIERLERKGRTTMPGIIRPADAMRLALSLLKAARGQVTMRQFMQYARRRVFLFSEQRDEHSESKETALQPAFTHEPRWVEADRRYRRCVAALANADVRLREVLCGYLLPRDLENAAVTASQFGDESTIDSRRKRVLAILRDALLDPYEFERGPRGPYVEEEVKAITRVVLRRLLDEFCRNCIETSPSPSPNT